MSAMWLGLAILFSLLTASRGIDCSDLTPCRTLTQQHCVSDGVLCVGYYDCKRCPRRVCDEGAVTCTHNRNTQCAVERETAKGREGNCSRPDDSDDLEKCENPTGGCDWYTKCLYRYFPKCSGSDNYALSYGQKFCDKYTAEFYRFSESGKRWIGEVRKCLQDAIAQDISALPDTACAGIKKKAFDSHTPCYVEPSDDSSVCDLGGGDMLRVLDTIKGGFVNEFMGSVGQGLQVGGKCGTRKARQFGQAISSTFKRVKYTVITKFKSLVGKRSTGCDNKCLAAMLTGSIFNTTDMPTNSSIEWFAFSEEVQEELVITVLITSFHFLNADINSTIAAAEEELQIVAETFFNNVVKQREVVVDGKTRRIHQVSACGDVNCDKDSSKIVKLKYDVVGGVESQHKRNWIFCFINFMVAIFIMVGL